MAEEMNHPARQGHAHAGLRTVLAAVCCGVFIAFLILLAINARANPLAPLLDVRLSAIGVCINFAVCLGAAAVFGYLRRGSSADRER